MIFSIRVNIALILKLLSLLIRHCRSSPREHPWPPCSWDC